MSNFFTEFGGGCSTTSAKTKNNTERLEMQLDAWWDKIWRLFGSIRLDMSSGRLIAGNHLLPSAFALTFENFHCEILLNKFYLYIDSFFFLILISF